MKKIPLHRWVGGCKSIPETRKFAVVAYALVDDWWYDRLVAMGTWMFHDKYDKRTGYAWLAGTCPMLKMHWLVGGKGWDYRDGDGLNNQESNLRPADRSQQAANKIADRDSSSGERGVTWLKTKAKWYVQVKKNKKYVFRAYFDSEEEAVRVARQKRKEIHGEFVRA